MGPKAFETIDKDKSGTISLQEFATLVRKIDENLGDEQVYFLFRRFDEDGDALISSKEFMKFF